MTLIQRPLRGSRISSFYPIKSLPSLSSLDSAFQLQEYISLLIRLDVHDVDTIVSVPGKSTGREKPDNVAEELKGEEGEKEKEGKNEVTVDEACWIYEQLRRLAQDLSHPLITMLQQECTRASCPEMKAGEWLYLCVAHGNDGAMEQCCAIDYILHTLDSATALLNSPRAFPSRLSVPPSSHRHFSSLARRLGRIFAHAYFHHREAFEQAEAESSLYARFLALTSKFELVPAEFLVIPTPSISGSGEGRGRDIEVQPPRLLAASVERHNVVEQHDINHNPHAELGSDLGVAEWDDKPNQRGNNPPGLSGPGPAQGGEHSPRRYGRSRTDTMVFSEAFNVAEELAKEHQEHEPEQDHQHEAHGEAGEITIESAEATAAPVVVVESATEEPETTAVEPEITVPSHEAPTPESVPIPEDLPAPEDALISATEVEPAPAPSADLAEELTTSPFEPPITSQPEIAADATKPSSDTPNVDAPEEPSHVVEPVVETEPTSAPAPTQEEHTTTAEEAKEPEHIEEPAPETVKEPEAPETTPIEEPAPDTAPVETVPVHEAVTVDEAESKIEETNTPAVVDEEETSAVASSEIATPDSSAATETPLEASAEIPAAVAEVPAATLEETAEAPAEAPAEAETHEKPEPSS